jgi:carboxylate-amine ligase
VPAAVVVQALIDHVAPALSDAGDHAAVQALWQDLRRRRPGAHHQRLAYRDGGLVSVVDDAITAANHAGDDAATGHSPDG